MAVGPYNGRFAQVMVSTSAITVDCLGSWKLDISQDEIDASVFGTVWGQNMRGQAKWSGSFEGFFSFSTAAGSTGQNYLLNAAINQTKVQTLKLFLNSTADGSTTAYFWMPNCSTDITNYSTNAGVYIGDVSIGQEKNGLASVSYTYSGYGPLCMCVGTSTNGVVY